jgi:hypothetical protein
MDAGSTPLRDCFTDIPDFTPYHAVSNQVPLNQINPPATALTDPKMKGYAEISGTMPFDRIDACDEDLLNHILWFAMKGSQSTYPKWAVVPVELRGIDDDDD